MAYQWRKDDVDLPGETGPSLLVDPVGEGDVGEYACLVSNGCADVATRSALLSLNAPRRFHDPADERGDLSWRPGFAPCRRQRDGALVLSMAQGWKPHRQRG